MEFRVWNGVMRNRFDVVGGFPSPPTPLPRRGEGRRGANSTGQIQHRPNSTQPPDFSALALNLGR
jgi:hypothetical protein